MNLDILGPLLGLLIALQVAVLIGNLIGFIWGAIAFGAIATKAGQPSWAGWVPIYNNVIFYRIAAMSPAVFFIMIFGGLGVNLVGGVIAQGMIQNGSYDAAGVVSGISTFLFLVMYVVGLINVLIAAHRINLGFGRGAGMTALAFFFPLIWLSVLAWGSAQWQGVPSHMVAAPTAPAPAPAAPAGGAPTLGDASTGAVPPVPPPPAAPGRPPAPPSGAVPPPPPPGASIPPASSAPPAPPAPPTTVGPPSPPAPSVPPVPAAAPSVSRSPWEPPISSAPVSSAPIAAVPTAAPAAPPAPPTVNAPPAEPVALVSPPAPPAAPAPPVAPPAPPAAAAPLAEPAAPTAPASPAPVAEDDPIDGATVAAPGFALPQDEPDDLDDRTVVAPRIVLPRYSLLLSDGTALALTGDAVVLGRRPSTDAQWTGAQLLSVPDSTKTMSKNHALLRREGENWTITDLASTNGVSTFAADGSETVLQAGAPTPVAGEFALGQVRLSIQKES